MAKLLIKDLNSTTHLDTDAMGGVVGGLSSYLWYSPYNLKATGFEVSNASMGLKNQLPIESWDFESIVPPLER